MRIFLAALLAFLLCSQPAYAGLKAVSTTQGGGGGSGGTIGTATPNDVGVYSGANAISGYAPFTYNSGVVSIGTASTIGQIVLYGNTSGSVTITPQAVAGTPTVTFGTSSGTPAVTASSPLVISATTGNITCPTCNTSSASGTVNSGTATYSAFYSTTGTAVSSTADMTYQNGGATIGTGYAASSPPLNGLIVQGNVGIGTTQINNNVVMSIWVGNSTNVDIQNGDAGLLEGDGFITSVYGNYINSQNCYYNGSSWTYQLTAACSQFQASGGNLLFQTAPSGTGGTTATLTERMRILNTGGVGIGTSSLYASTKLDVAGTINQSTELSCSTGLTTDANGSINGCVASDPSLKLNIEAASYDPALLEKLAPVTYYWKDQSKFDNHQHYGFNAQQVYGVTPLLTKPAGKDLLGIDNSGMEAVIILELKHQQEEIDHIREGRDGYRCYGVFWCKDR